MGKHFKQAARIGHPCLARRQEGGARASAFNAASCITSAASVLMGLACITSAVIWGERVVLSPWPLVAGGAMLILSFVSIALALAARIRGGHGDATGPRLSFGEVAER